MCILQFSFRSKEKFDKKFKPPRPGLREVSEGNESNGSGQPSKMKISEADVDHYLEQMLVSVSLLDVKFLLFHDQYFAD